MKKIKNLAVVILVLFVVLVLIIARSTNKNHFNQESKNAIEASINGQNTISFDELRKGNYFVVDFNNPNSQLSQLENSIKIPFENLLDKESQKILKESKQDIALFSSDISTSSKAWIILNQLGYSNVYLVETKENSEVLKYKFQPDTVGLE